MKLDYVMEGLLALLTVVVPNVYMFLIFKRVTGKDTRLIESDRLPSYSTEAIDIEVFTGTEWRGVASTSRRTDAPDIAGHKPLMNLDLAFGIDRLVVLSS